jgi:putative addiction module component (TIGR02574 family)
MSIPEPPGFADLSKAEQIEYLQMLWDRIAEREDVLPPLESHLALVEQRLAAYRQDPSKARPVHEILDRLADGNS